MATTSANERLHLSTEVMRKFSGHEELIRTLLENRFLRPFPVPGSDFAFYSTDMVRAIELIIERNIPLNRLMKQIDNEGNMVSGTENNIYYIDMESQNPVLDRKALRLFDRETERATATVARAGTTRNNTVEVFGVEETPIVVTEPTEETVVTPTVETPVVEETVVTAPVTNNDGVVNTENNTQVVGNVVEWLLHTPFETFLSEEEQNIVSIYSQNMILGETQYGKLSLERIRHLPEFEANRPNNFRRLTRLETIAYLLMSLEIIPDNGRREMLVDKANIINTLTNRELEAEYIVSLETKYRNAEPETEDVDAPVLEEPVVETPEFGNIESPVELSAREKIANLLELPDNVLEELWSYIEPQIPEELR